MLSTLLLPYYSVLRCTFDSQIYFSPRLMALKKSLNNTWGIFDHGKRASFTQLVSFFKRFGCSFSPVQSLTPSLPQSSSLSSLCSGRALSYDYQMSLLLLISLLEGPPSPFLIIKVESVFLTLLEIAISSTAFQLGAISFPFKFYGTLLASYIL